VRGMPRSLRSLAIPPLDVVENDNEIIEEPVSGNLRNTTFSTQKNTTPLKQIILKKKKI